MRKSRLFFQDPEQLPAAAEEALSHEDLPRAGAELAKHQQQRRGRRLGPLQGEAPSSSPSSSPSSAPAFAAVSFLLFGIEGRYRVPGVLLRVLRRKKGQGGSSAGLRAAGEGGERRVRRGER